MAATQFRTVNGKRFKRCGGYVSWDGRGKDQHGFPVRRQKELRVWVPCGVQVDDCGAGTALLVRKLKAKAEKAGKRNVEVRECWEY